MKRRSGSSNLEEKRAKPLTKKRMHRRLRLSFGLLGGVLLLCLGAYILRWRPYGVSLSLGDRVPEDILAPYAMEDAYLTEISRQKARQEAAPVYVSGEDAAQEAKARLEERFDRLETFINEAAALWQEEAERFDGQYYYNSKSWQSMLSEQKLLDRLASNKLTDLVSAAAGYALLEEYVPQGQRTVNQPGDIGNLKEAFYAVLEPLWAEGVSPENEEALQQQAASALKQGNLPAAVKTELAENILKQYLVSTAKVDEEATESAREQAARSVAPVMLEKGQVILSAGTLVGQGELSHLRQLGLLFDGGSFMARLGSYVLYLLLCFGVYGLYLLLYCKRLLLKRRDMLFLTGVLTAALGLSLLTGLFAPRWLPFLLGALVLGRRLESGDFVPVAALLAFTVCPMGADEGLFSAQAFAMMTAGLLGGLMAGMVSSLLSHKKGMAFAALLGGALGGLCRILPLLYAGEEGVYIAGEMGCALGGATLSLGLGLGLEMLLERLAAERNGKERAHD